jgi:ligand-binding sensor domain-containing protein
VKHLLFGFLFLINIVCFQAQGDYRFNNFTISNGLSQSFVTSIIQDENACLWIGTQDGLNRFDGKTFEIFNSDETPGIDNTYIKCSAKTRNGKLWFGTASGLILYEPLKDKFTTFNISRSVLLQIESISNDSEDNLWLAIADYGLVKFNTKTLKFERNFNFLPTKKIHLVSCFGKNQLVIDTEDKGLLICNHKTKAVSKVELLSKKKNEISILKIVPFSKKHIYLGTNQGVFERQLSERICKRGR